MSWDESADYQTDLDIPSGKFGKLIAIPGGPGPSGPPGPAGPAGPPGPDEGVEFTVNKGQPGGYAPLGPDGNLPVENLPDGVEFVAAKGIADGYAPLDSAARLPRTNLPVTALERDVYAVNESGIRTQDHPTLGRGYIFGTVVGYGFSPPNGIHMPFFVYQEWSKDSPGTPVTATTQAGGFISAYWGPAPEACYSLSSYAFLRANDRTETSTDGFVQESGATGFEAGVQIQGANRIINSGGRDAPALCVGARCDMDPQTHADSVYMFKAVVTAGAGTTLGDSGDLSKMGTIGRYIGFYQENSPPNATQKIGVYVIDPVVTETSIWALKQGVSGQFTVNPKGYVDTPKSFQYVNLPSTTDVPGSTTGIRLIGGVGQARPLQEWWVNGAAQPATRIIPNGMVQTSAGFGVADSAYSAYQIEMSTGGLTLTGKNIIFAGTTGSKIGTSATQKIGFWNAAPQAQPAGISDAIDATTAVTQLNKLLAALRGIGLIAAGAGAAKADDEPELTEEHIDPSWWVQFPLYEGVEDEWNDTKEIGL